MGRGTGRRTTGTDSAGGQGAVALSPMDVTQFAAVDAARAARVLSEVRSARLSGGQAPVAPRR